MSVHLRLLVAAMLLAIWAAAVLSMCRVGIVSRRLAFGYEPDGKFCGFCRRNVIGFARAFRCDWLRSGQP